MNFLEYEPAQLRNFDYFDIPIDFILSDIILPKHFSTIPHIFISEYVTNKKLKFIRKTINDAIEEKETLKFKVPIEK